MSELTNEQIENLHHTSMQSFYHKQPERFEIMYIAGKAPRIIEDEHSHLRWYESQLEALFAFNYFAKIHRLSLLLISLTKIIEEIKLLSCQLKKQLPFLK